jgi:hypothetical protein
METHLIVTVDKPDDRFNFARPGVTVPHSQAATPVINPKDD